MSQYNKNDEPSSYHIKPLPKRAASKNKKNTPSISALSNMPSKKYLAVIGIALAVLLSVFFFSMQLGFSIYGGNKMPEPTPVPSEEPEITDNMLVPVDKATGIINILLLGVDIEGYRTDTIILASYNLDDNKINLLSIPRDTRMYIGKKYQKINAAHAIPQSGSIKGPQGSIEAVTRLTGIPINYYVEYSFSAFRNTVDSLGGIDFDVPQNMDYDDPVQDLHIHLKKGFQHLDGDKSEQLVRFRRYPMGDLTRVEMQQQFLAALLEQKLKPETIKNVPALFEQWNKDINTNLSALDIARLLPNILELTKDDISMYLVEGEYNDTDYGASYWIPNMKKLKTLISETFEYDSSKITIHSSDGSSVSKDVKTSSKSTDKPSQSPNKSSKAEHTPSASPAPEKSPHAKSSPVPSSASAKNETVKKTPKPITENTISADKKSDEDKLSVSETKKPESIKNIGSPEKDSETKQNENSVRQDDTQNNENEKTQTERKDIILDRNTVLEKNNNKPDSIKINLK